MPAFSLTGDYKLAKVQKAGKNQVAFLKDRFGDRTIVIGGIPANIDLSGNVGMMTWHMSGAKEKDETKPDNIEIYRMDEKGAMLRDPAIKLFRKPDGTYRCQTEEEKAKTEIANMNIISEVLGNKR